jgi:hypothetical protein
MHIDHAKHRLVLIALLVVWALGSWYWYVCPIKGFCGARPAPTQAVVREAAPCAGYLTGSIHRGWQNDAAEVAKLQTFLNTYAGEDLSVTGTYGAADEAAVRRFQEKYRDEVLTPWGKSQPTGYVYSTTRAKINQLYCEGQATIH